ncbi:MAG: NACHT domain-containing protein [Brasilonema octagenarum HA4186-MV1]|jgi:predicted NACHT family NTPase|nr:NACHT domain-containing protein [Brasilonema octagenarum HA4186-MV1]
MSRRSLQASAEGMKKAQAALIRNSLTQQALAEELSISRQPVSKFFQGKPVDRYIFVTICEKLGLEWDEIASFCSLPDVDDAASTSQMESLVQTVREKVHDSIARRCNIIRLLDKEQPVSLESIYTDVYILERVTGRRRLSLAQLYESSDKNKIYQKRISGLERVERYNKHWIWGKPGSGKTTFLKWVATQCNSDQFLSNLVPIFITLKDFAETKGQPSLLDYITVQFEECGVVEPQTVLTLLTQGRSLLLLDGLDEVKKTELNRVLQEIRNVSTRFCANSIVITCRIAALEYTFEEFTEVEVADFDDQQIADFAAKWFQAQDTLQAERFVQKLQASQPLKELASNPLLLTLLCLVFDETADFPTHCLQLYQEAVDLLLKKWDAKRGIERNQVYKQSRQDKEDMLSQIAWTTFERGEYFFKVSAVKKGISHHIHTSPENSTFLETLQVDSEDILKSIEAQHGLLVERARGIYSFGHIIFQKYFAARKIVASPPSHAQEAFQNLVCHMSEKRWREVFLFAVQMLPNPDYLLQLMKRQLDSLVADDETQYDNAKQLLIDCLNNPSC